MEILRVTESNVRQAARVHSASWRKSHESFCTPRFVRVHTTSHREKYLLEKMGKDSRVFMLADPECVGVVSVTGDLIEDLYVLPSKQDMGYGTKLLEYAVTQCSGTPRLWVLENNERAAALYTRKGFIPTGNRKVHPGGFDEIEYRFKEKRTMQNRMKQHQLDKAQIDSLLEEAEVAALATLNEDGYPYVTPVHFFHEDDMIYVHGLPVGQKVSNIRRDGRVSLTVWRLDSYLMDDEGRPCETNTEYHSVIIQGKAAMVEDETKKRRMLDLIVSKYTPGLAGAYLPDNMVKGTGVICISIEEISGKYYR